jgi:hypothetical protein
LPRYMALHRAAGPDMGQVIPMTTSSSVTPGVSDPADTKAGSTRNTTRKIVKYRYLFISTS